MRTFDDTICAPATIPGTGAICIIRVSGPDAIAAVGRIAGTGNFNKTDGYSIRFLPIAGIDDVLASVFRAPKSYTGEDCVEISCHSSSVIVEDIISHLLKEGVRLAEPGEFTLRAYLNGKMDLSQAEAVADLIGANGKASRDIALKQLKGGYSSELKTLRDEMKQIASLLELELDFSEEEVEFASRDKVHSLLQTTEEKIRGLASSFAKGDAIRNGIPVAIVGEPNSGKSTLLNAFAGEERAIVSKIAGTTRDTIEETIDIDGLKFRIIDTAGIHSTKDEIEEIGISRAFEAIAKAKVILALNDASKKRESAGKRKCEPSNAKQESSEIIEDKLLDEIQSKIPEGSKLIHVITKCDLVANIAETQEHIESTMHQETTVYISAKTGFGMEKLKEAIARDFRNCLSEGVVVTSQRHYEALQSSLTALRSAIRSLEADVPTDLLAEDLRNAISSLSSIWGETITTNEILQNIFSHFCIGK